MTLKAATLAIGLFLIGCGAETPPPRPPETREEQPQVVVAAEIDHLDQAPLLSIDKEENRDEVLELIALYRREALAGVDPAASPRTKLLHLNWYVHTRFESVEVSPFSLLEALRRRHANCSASSAIMQLMARGIGIPSRTAGISGIPIQAGHTTAEFMWDDEWHFIDPTFGVFITNDGTVDGEILSLDSIMKHRGHIASNIFYPNSAGRMGWNYTAAKPGTFDAMYTLTQVAMQAGGNYELFLQTTSGAVPYDNGYVMNTIYYADMATATTFSFGTDDGSGADVNAHRPVSDIPNDYDGPGLKYVGRWQGVYGPLECIQSHIISGFTPGDTFTFTLDAVEQSSAWLKVRVRKGEILSSHYTGTRATFQIKALREDIVISVSDLLNETEAHFTSLDYFAYAKP